MTMSAFVTSIGQNTVESTTIAAIFLVSYQINIVYLANLNI